MLFIYIHDFIGMLERENLEGVERKARQYQEAAKEATKHQEEDFRYKVFHYSCQRSCKNIYERKGMEYGTNCKLKGK